MTHLFSQMSKAISSQLLMIVTGMIALSCISFSGCKSGKSTTNSEKIVVAPVAAPEWVGSRPHSSANYIGIGSCSKLSQPMDYQTIAKKNALNDLASEISVQVKGETFLNTLEVNKNFSEEFISKISTTTDEKIENFEIAGSWENEKEFWTYYRLNKAEYQRQKMEKKNQALSASYDYYLKGKAAEENANISAAFDLYMHGLFSLKEYWAEVNDYNTETGKVHLDNEIYSSMQRITAGLTIKPGTTKVILSSENKYNVDIPAMVEYEGKPVNGISVSYHYNKTNYMKPRSFITSDGGKLTVNVSGVSSAEKSNNLDMKINLDPLIAGDLDKQIQTGLMRNMKTDSRSIPIEMRSPSFFIQSVELSYGVPSQGSLLASALNSELAKQGMRVVTAHGENDFDVMITSNTTAGGSSQGFVVAFLEMTVKVKSVKSGEIVYQESLSAIKGLQLNVGAASMEAYKKGKEKIEQQISKSILEAIL